MTDYVAHASPPHLQVAGTGTTTEAGTVIGAAAAGAAVAAGKWLHPLQPEKRHMQLVFARLSLSLLPGHAVVCSQSCRSHRPCPQEET
jgi:hypothetical protein